MQREFPTPEPVTIEIRNAAGDVDIELVDTPSSDTPSSDTDSFDTDSFDTGSFDTGSSDTGPAGEVRAVQTTTVEVRSGSGQPMGFLDDVLRAVNSGRIGDELRNAFGRRDSGDGPGGGGPASWFGGFGSATATDADPTERVRIEHTAPRADGRRAIVIVDTDPARSGWRSSFTIRVRAPRGSGVRAQTQSADVTVVGVADRLEIRTASGAVAVDRVTEKAVVHTASGSVTVTEAADADVRTASGRVGLHQVDDRLVVHTTSGDVRVDRSGGDGSVRTVSGEVRLAEVGAGRLEVVTVSGAVDVALRPGTSAAVELSTVAGASDSELDITERLGGGDAAVDPGPATPDLDLRVGTTSGDIRLRRAVTV